MRDPKTCARAALLALMCAAAPWARADTVSYETRLVVENVFYPTYPDGMSCLQAVALSSAPSFGCGWESSEAILIGGFRLHADPGPLADGIYSFIELDSWAIRIGEVEWDMNRPDSEFAGFRDGAYCGAAGTGFSQINPGLVVNGNAVTGFCGGVFGRSDTPFIDFDYAAGTGGFSALDSGGIRLSGHYTISPAATAAVSNVPEPGGLSLAVFGLGLLGYTCRRRAVSPTPPPAASQPFRRDTR